MYVYINNIYIYIHVHINIREIEKKVTIPPASSDKLALINILDTYTQPVHTYTTDIHRNAYTETQG